MIMVLRKLAMELASRKMQIYFPIILRLLIIIFDHIFITLYIELMEEFTPLINICIHFD